MKFRDPPALTRLRQLPSICSQLQASPCSFIPLICGQRCTISRVVKLIEKSAKDIQNSPSCSNVRPRCTRSEFERSAHSRDLNMRHREKVKFISDQVCIACAFGITLSLSAFIFSNNNTSCVVTCYYSTYTYMIVHIHDCMFLCISYSTSLGLRDKIPAICGF